MRWPRPRTPTWCETPRRGSERLPDAAGRRLRGSRRSLPRDASSVHEPRLCVVPHAHGLVRSPIHDLVTRARRAVFPDRRVDTSAGGLVLTECQYMPRRRDLARRVELARAACEVVRT